jgi:hypothetical protein
MGPPSQPKRTSSLRKPARQDVVASIGATHPLRNASSANTPRIQNGSELRPQPVSLGAAAVIQRPQSTDKSGTTQTSAVEALTKRRIPLHSRSRSASGLIAPQAHRQEYIGAHSKDVSGSSYRTIPPKSLHASGQGQNISGIRKVTADRPEFSTYQQHFSPRKALKAPAPPIPGQSNGQQHSSSRSSEATKNYCGPDEETANLQAQTSRLQDELLQLQIIHDSSYSQRKTYLENTMRKFKEQFASLSRDHRAVAAQEYAYYTTSNRVSLQQWLSEGDLSGSRKIQTLAQCIQDVATLTAPDGKLYMAIEQFETWFERMILTTSSRMSGTALLELNDILVSPLGEEWHDLAAVLHRKLEHCSAILKNLGSAKEGSGLAIVLDAHILLVDNLRQQLEYSSAIEKSTLQQEQAWIAESIAKILHEDDPIAVDCQQDNLRLGAWNVDTT